MRVEFYKSVEDIQDDLMVGFGVKFAVIESIQGNSREQILLLFNCDNNHALTAENWIINNHGEFKGAGIIILSKNKIEWGSQSCLRQPIDLGFGKDRPEDSKESDRLLALVREKVTKLVESLQEA